MRKFSLILVLGFILLGSVLVSERNFPARSAAATTGTVCLDLAPSTSCPASPAIFSGELNTTFVLDVNIQGSDAFNGFDIKLQTNSSVLKPISVDTSGTILPGQTVTLVKCVDQAGSGCEATDYAGVVHLAMVALGNFTGSPATGLLFSVTYLVVGHSTGDNMVFATSCTGRTSVPGICVTITNPNLPNAIALEQVQEATFSNLPVTPDFMVSVNPASLSLRPSNSSMVAVTVTSVGGFSGNIFLNVSLSTFVGNSTQIPSGVQASVNPSSVPLAPGGTATSVLTFNASPNATLGTYTFILEASNATLARFVTIKLSVGFAPRLGFPFHDDLNYSTMSELFSSGWVTCSTAPSSWYTIGGGFLTLTDDGTNGAGVCLPAPTGLVDWSYSTRAAWVGGSVGSIKLTVFSTHIYEWQADGYYNTFHLLRDHVAVFTVNGYQPQLNVYHDLRVDAQNGTLSMYFDGRLMGTYQESDPTTVSSVSLAASWNAVNSFDSVSGGHPTAQGFSFHDDFNYTSIAQLEAAGWGINTATPLSYYSVGGGLLSLLDDGTVGGSVTYTVPAGIGDWSASVSEEWIGNPVGNLQIWPHTPTHGYGWQADGYYHEWSFYRDGATIFSVPGYQPVLNVFHTLRVDMRSGILHFYYDGVELGTYTEPTPDNLSHVDLGGSWDTNNKFDFFEVAPVDTSKPDFTIAPHPVSLDVPQNGQGTSTVVLNPLSSMDSTVSLNSLVSPPGLTLLLSPMMVNLANGINGSSTLTASGSPGNYVVTVEGTSGSILHSTTITVNVAAPSPPDFTMGAFPSMLTIQAGGNATSLISLSSVNGFAGSVILSSFSSQYSISTFVNPSIVQLVANGTGSATLMVSTFQYAPIGFFNITVTGSSGTLTHAVSLTVDVTPPPADFVISVFPQSVSVFAGETATASVDVFGQNGFLGTVTLSSLVVGQPNGISSSLTPGSVFISPSLGSLFSTLKILSTPSAPPGNYTVTITGSSLFLTHTVQVQLVVLPRPVILASPSSGKLGDLITVNGSGFIFPQGGFVVVSPEVEVTFDSQLLGLVFPQNGSFTFQFNVPHADPTVLHHIHAVLFAGIDVQTDFTVLPEPSPVSLSVSVNTGGIYFPGDIVVFYVSTTSNGAFVNANGVELTVYFPNGTSTTLTTVSVSMGVLKASLSLSRTATVGTYAAVATARLNGANATSLSVFEVESAWNSPGRTILAALGLPDSMPMISIVGLIIAGLATLSLAFLTRKTPITSNGS